MLPFWQQILAHHCIDLLVKTVNSKYKLFLAYIDNPRTAALLQGYIIAVNVGVRVCLRAHACHRGHLRILTAVCHSFLGHMT